MQTYYLLLNELESVVVQPSRWAASHHISGDASSLCSETHFTICILRDRAHTSSPLIPLLGTVMLTPDPIDEPVRLRISAIMVESVLAPFAILGPQLLGEQAEIPSDDSADRFTDRCGSGGVIPHHAAGRAAFQ